MGNPYGDTPEAKRRVMAAECGFTGVSSEVPDVPDQPIGPYRLVAKIGEGGFGIIYRAEQREPVAREVAIKLIRAGLDTDVVMARFRREQEALGTMNHPNIARFYDGGETGDGRPYFVMEFIDGTCLTDFCAREKLGLAGRVRLIRDLCHAVQHAHQKGVFHRDLKPSNVMVTLSGGRPIPKIIDFGVADIVSGRRDPSEAATSAFHTIGTPLYMSPEQARMASDVDARTDIYGLGLLLYEVLTGEPLVTFDDDPGASPEDALRAICEHEPARPSVRVRDVGRDRGLGNSMEAEWERALRGDLDWVVMQAVAKERERRYQTAAALAEDLDRFLRRVPVSAGPPGTWRQVGKFARRYRAALTIAASVAGALLVAFFASVRMHARAESALEDVRSLRREVELEFALREESRAAAESLMGFALGDLYTRLDKESFPRSLTEAANRVLVFYERQPAPEDAGLGENRARLYLNAGNILFASGHADKAAAALGKAVAVSSAIAERDDFRVSAKVALAQAHLRLGQLRRITGDDPAAARHFAEAEAVWNRLDGLEMMKDDTRLAYAAFCAEMVSGLQARGEFPEASRWGRREVEMRERISDTGGESGLPLLVDARRRLALTLHQAGDTAGAGRYLHDATEALVDDVVFGEAGREVLHLLFRCYETRARFYGPGDPEAQRALQLAVEVFGKIDSPAGPWQLELADVYRRLTALALRRQARSEASLSGRAGLAILDRIAGEGTRSSNAAWIRPAKAIRKDIVAMLPDLEPPSRTESRDVH